MIFILLVLLILSACSPVATNSGAEVSTPAVDSGSAGQALTIDASRIESRDIERTIEAIGTLHPNEEVTVSNQVEGLVSKVFVDLGDAVRAGQLIAELDTRELELAVNQQSAALQQEMARLGLTDPSASVDEAATSQVRQAEAAFAEAKLRLDRTRSLAGEGVVARQQLDEQQAKYDIADAALKSARESVRNIKATVAVRKAALDLAHKKLADAKIVAPISGLVKERLVSEGAYLRANSPVVTLVQNVPLKLRLEVPETAIESVRTGRPVRFTVDSLPDREFGGRITRLSPSVDQSSRTLKVEALVDNSDGTLKPGLFTRVTVLTGRKEPALVAPGQAVFSFAGLEKVFVVSDGKVSERIVRTGTRMDGVVEILEGVQAGDMVAISNLGNLQQGREVLVK